MDAAAVPETFGLENFVGGVNVLKLDGQEAGIQIEVIADFIADTGRRVFGEMRRAT